MQTTDRLNQRSVLNEQLSRNLAKALLQALHFPESKYTALSAIFHRRKRLITGFPDNVDSFAQRLFLPLY